MESVSKRKFDDVNPPPKPRLVLSLLIRLVRERKWMRSTTSVCLTLWIVCSLSPMKDCSSIWKNAWLPWRTRQGPCTHIHLVAALLWIILLPNGGHRAAHVLLRAKINFDTVSWLCCAELPHSGPWELPETTWRIPPHPGQWDSKTSLLTLETVNCVQWICPSTKA